MKFLVNIVMFIGLLLLTPFTFAASWYQTDLRLAVYDTKQTWLLFMAGR